MYKSVFLRGTVCDKAIAVLGIESFHGSIRQFCGQLGLVADI